MGVFVGNPRFGLAFSSFSIRLPILPDLRAKYSPTEIFRPAQDLFIDIARHFTAPYAAVLGSPPSKENQDRMPDQGAQ